MSIDILPVETVLERDIDILLLEEFSTDDSFCRWFIETIELPTFKKRINVLKSITDYGQGETDLLFSYASLNNQTIFVLIENKLDTNFQENQYERYVKRGDEYLKHKKCNQVFNVLVAPKKYCLNQYYFERFVSYEDISNKISKAKTKRSLFKSRLFSIAIDKQRRGYQAINSVIVQNFWYSYWLFKEKQYPSLVMRKPGVVPFNSDWPMLYDNRIKNITFIHKLKQGNVDATLKPLSKINEAKLKSILPKWISYEKHSKNCSLRIFSGKVDRTKDFNSQLENINKGLNNIIQLRNWILENKIYSLL